jgi:precorrin-4/cobalt-precorrin-4 C11-methyltransferase
VISFVGAGPGAPDLLTLRGAQRLADAEVVIWAASLVPEAVLMHCRANVARYDSKTMTLEEVTAVYAAHPEAAIVRLHSGDPTVYGAIAEQIDWCVAHERAFEIVPGVTSMAAAAAAFGRELTVPAVSQSVVMTRLAHRTSAAMPEHEGVAAFAAHGATMAVFLSAARPEELQRELLAIGSRYSPDTPVAVASRVSWPDERLLRSTVGGLADDLRALGVTATVMVLVGPALGDPGTGGSPAPIRSHVYSPTYAHTFRSAHSASDDPTPAGGHGD